MGSNTLPVTDPAAAQLAASPTPAPTNSSPVPAPSPTPVPVPSGAPGGSELLIVQRDGYSPPVTNYPRGFLRLLNPADPVTNDGVLTALSCCVDMANGIIYAVRATPGQDTPIADGSPLSANCAVVMPLPGTGLELVVTWLWEGVAGGGCLCFGPPYPTTTTTY